MSVVPSIDINSDVGERVKSLEDGSEEELMRCITSANIACGGHAGDAESMRATAVLAKKYGVAIGAHPGYPDRQHFGRVEMNLSADEIERSVFEQISALEQVCRGVPCDLFHVKPHGALYNVAVKNPVVAKAIARGVIRLRPDLTLVGLAGSTMLEVWMAAGLRVAGEAFADRAYEADGSLRSRTFSDALITDPHRAAHQALRIAVERKVRAVSGKELRVDAQTICVHSDTPNAVLIGRSVRQALAEAGVEVRGFGG